MTRNTIIISLVAGVVGATAIGAGIAAATGVAGDDTDTPITGDALVAASEAALAHTGEGRVTDTEVGDEDSLYEVEVRLDDGTEVDVQLDENFDVVGESQDVAGEPDTD